MTSHDVARVPQSLTIVKSNPINDCQQSVLEAKVTLVSSKPIQ